MANRMDTPTLARKHLDRKLAVFRTREDLARPPRGWVRAIRDALGMTTRQLAKRVGISQPGIVALEKGEMNDTVSLGTLRQAAEALDCKLVYVLVPNISLDAMVRARAEALAEKQMSRITHTMRLENQGLGADDLATERARVIDELLRGDVKRLWDEP